MLKITSLSLALACSFALLTVGCQSHGHDHESGTQAEPTTEAASPSATESGEVAYEPAYPEDVSEEGLTEDDVAQQEPGQSQEDKHSHGEGEHEHDDSEDHSHDH